MGKKAVKVQQSLEKFRILYTLNKTIDKQETLLGQIETTIAELEMSYDDTRDDIKKVRVFEVKVELSVDILKQGVKMIQDGGDAKEIMEVVEASMGKISWKIGE